MLALVAVRQHALLGAVSGATDDSWPGAGLWLAGGIGGNFPLNGLSSSLPEGEPTPRRRSSLRPYGVRPKGYKSVALEKRADRRDIEGAFESPQSAAGAPMPNKLEQLRAISTVVADTGDMESIRAFKPTDATTNPSLILKASQMPAYAQLVEEAIVWGRRNGAAVGDVTDRIAINFGSELTRIVPGRVSTEVNADLSFDTDATVAKAKKLIAQYEERGISRNRI